MSKLLHTSIEIDASPDRVWNILTEFTAYPEWNPFIPRITGNAAIGERLAVTLQPPGGRAMGMKPTVRAADRNREFRWLGRLGGPGIFDGEHAFRIEPLAPNRVRFVQEERFSGILTSLILHFVEKGTRQGFEAMNRALKQRAESSTPAANDKG